MNKSKIFVAVALLNIGVSTHPKDDPAQREIEEKNIFDNRIWDGKQKDFTHFRNTTDLIVRPLNGAGVFPLVKGTDGKLYFLLSVAIVENGTDESIGKDPVYTNPSNYPIVDPKDRVLAQGTELPFETSIDMAARPEEIGILSGQFTFSFIKNCIQQTGRLLPNAGMWFGRYAVPTYLIYCGCITDFSIMLESVEQKIATQDYNKLFPTESSMKRTDKIVTFALVPAQKLLDAVKAQGNNRIERPLTIEGCPYKLSPYVARTIALNNNMAVIEEALASYEVLACA